jgi:hypothetical protein
LQWHPPQDEQEWEPQEQPFPALPSVMLETEYCCSTSCDAQLGQTIRLAILSFMVMVSSNASLQALHLNSYLGICFPLSGTEINGVLTKEYYIHP